MAHTHPDGKGAHCGGEHREPVPALTDREKLNRMVEHWVHHNGEHEQSYRDWALRARQMGMDEVGRLLEKSADEVVLQNEGLERVLDLLKNDPTSR